VSRTEKGLASRLAGFTGCVVIVAALASPARTELRAEQIDRDNVGEFLLPGPDAIGGVGDWALANDRIAVIVDDPSRAHGKLNHGGTIVDAAPRDGGDDQFARLFPIVNLDQRILIGFDRIRAEVDPDGAFARLVVSSSQGLRVVAPGLGWQRDLDPRTPRDEAVRNVFVETEYRVHPGDAFVHITTTLENRGAQPAPIFSYADVWMRGGRSLRSFVANTLDPAESLGFQHRSFDRNDLFSENPMKTHTFVAMSGLPSFAPLAYAITSPERAEQGLPFFGVTGPHVNLIAAFLAEPEESAPGLLDFVGMIFEELPPGASWVIRRRLLVSGHADVASLTDTIFPLLGVTDGRSGVAGRIEPAGLRVAIEVRDALSGAPVTQIAPIRIGPQAGTFRALLPPGRYRLILRAPQRPERSVEVVVDEGAFSELPLQRFVEPGRLVFDPAFADGGPGRVVVRGIDGTPDPVFEPELLEFRLDGEPAASGSEVGSIDFIGNRHDPRSVEIPPGRYRLTATRGFEWGIASAELEIAGPGAEAVVPAFDLERFVTLPGVLSADLHVHAEASDDSGISNEARLRSYVAEGVEVMVSTDHDHIARFDPALSALDLKRRIRVVVGVEVTGSAPNAEAPWTLGHHNAWPIAHRAYSHRRGAPPSQNRDVAQLYSELREVHGARVVQLNHPRDAKEDDVDDGAFFTHLGNVGEGFRPDLPIDAAPNRALLATAEDGRTRAIDFDAIELANGASRSQYRRVRDDWHSLLRQGVRRTGTANSDTHGPGQLAGYPRSYVDLRSSPDRGPVSFDAAVRDGRLFGTTGPMLIDFSLNGARMGDLVTSEKGVVQVTVDIAAAPWIPLQEVRLLVNGEVVRRFTDLADLPGGRFSEQIDLRVDADAFVTVEAGAPIEAEADEWAARNPGPYADVVAPGFVPMLFSNPIYIDRNANGRFDAPGLAPAGFRWSGLVGWTLALVTLAVIAALRRGRRPSRI
jgi:hypothetical protein